jgi:D-sedoheptulose 7-phosphate isomerase
MTLVTDRYNLQANGVRSLAEDGETARSFAASYAEHQQIFERVRELGPVVTAIAAKMLDVLLNGGKVLWCGNGGSAGDAQHLAAELVGRFQKERRGLASIALTTDSSVLTSIANDYGFSAIFRRQVEALGRAGDMLVGISTSGNSENVCAALEEARTLGLHTVALTGGTGGRMAALADFLLCIPSTTTARVQEAHIFCGHAICDIVETAMQLHERAAITERGGI